MIEIPNPCWHFLTQEYYDMNLGITINRCTLCGATVNKCVNRIDMNTESLKQEGYLK